MSKRRSNALGEVEALKQQCIFNYFPRFIDRVDVTTFLPPEIWMNIIIMFLQSVGCRCCIKRAVQIFARVNKVLHGIVNDEIDELRDQTYVNLCLFDNFTLRYNSGNTAEELYWMFRRLSHKHRRILREWCCCTRFVNYMELAGAKSLNLRLLPPNLVAIDSYAFANCRNLQLVRLPKTLQSLGAYAFRDCLRIDLKHLPESVLAMGNGVFDGAPQSFLPECYVNEFCSKIRKMPDENDSFYDNISLKSFSTRTSEKSDTVYRPHRESYFCEYEYREFNDKTTDFFLKQDENGEPILKQPFFINRPASEDGSDDYVMSEFEANWNSEDD